MAIWVRITHDPSTNADKTHISGVELRKIKGGQKVLHNLEKANAFFFFFFFNTSKITLSPENSVSALSTQL